MVPYSERTTSRITKNLEHPCVVVASNLLFDFVKVHAFRKISNWEGTPIDRSNKTVLYNRYRYTSTAYITDQRPSREASKTQ